MAPQITLDELIARFEVLLLDSDGVLIRGSDAIPGAPEAIKRLNALNKPYFILTNDASALPETRAARYRKLGLAIEPNRIITAGSLLTAYFFDMGLVGSRCIVLGTEDSAKYVQSAGGEVVPCDDDFDVVVIGDQLGFPFLEATAAVLTNLFGKIDRGEKPHLVLPNPDITYPEADGFGFASGAVALMFEAALELRYSASGNLVFARLGKPEIAMFDEALRQCGTRDAAMIGDTPATDIRGANRSGITSVLMDAGVTSTHHMALPAADRPIYRMQSLAP